MTRKAGKHFRQSSPGLRVVAELRSRRQYWDGPRGECSSATLTDGWNGNDHLNGLLHCPKCQSPLFLSVREDMSTSGSRPQPSSGWIASGVPRGSDALRSKWHETSTPGGTGQHSAGSSSTERQEPSPGPSGKPSYMEILASVGSLRTGQLFQLLHDLTETIEDRSVASSPLTSSTRDQD